MIKYSSRLSNFRRRSKAHSEDLHSYCVSRGAAAGQFYDDLYISAHMGQHGLAGHRSHNQYTPAGHTTFYNRNQVSEHRYVLSIYARMYITVEKLI